jgi:8-oxo-dGTP pyrophosphatase MutT (NUDIX family)
MTAIRVGVVDVYVVRITETGWRILTLQRAKDSRRPLSWETVHGRIDAGETPPQAAVRELREETGFTPERIYSVTVNPYYIVATDTVQLATVFCAFVGSDGVTISEEHQAYEWLTVDDALKRFTWPRTAEAIAHITKLLGTGDAGPAEDVLRINL